MEGEIAKFLRLYEKEYEAGQRALNGLACGVARHRFITRKMECMGKHHISLAHIVGEEEATKLIACQLREKSTHCVAL